MSRGGEKTTETRWLTSNRTLLHFEHYATVMHAVGSTSMCITCTCANYIRYFQHESSYIYFGHTNCVWQCWKWSRVLSDVSHLVSVFLLPTLLTWFYIKTFLLLFVLFLCVMKLRVRWFSGMCNSLGKVILTTHACIECTLLTSRPPQLHKATFTLPTTSEIVYIIQTEQETPTRTCMCSPS